MQGLGIDLRSFLFQVINFLVLLFVLRKYLYSPLRGLLAKRQEEVEASRKAAERLAQKVEADEASRKDELEQARSESKRLIQDARTQAAALEERLAEQAKHQAEQILARAEKEAEETKARAEREMRDELVATILQTTGKLLETGINEEEKRASTHHLVAKLPL